MSDITDDDTPRIASVVRSAGELLDAHGPLTLKLALDWKRGLRSPNLDPDSGGWRYETIVNAEGKDEVVPIPSDATGEAAIAFDELDGLYDELQTLLRRVEADAARLRNIIAAAVPPTAGLSVVDPVDWCSNHLRVEMCEPRHRGDLCRWCYDFKAVHGKMPPMALLGLRHRYGRVSEEQVKDSLRREGKHDETLDRVSASVRRARRRAS